MPLKLYEVEVTYYVIADSPEAAEELPRHFDFSECTVNACEAESVDVGWWEALPFGDEGDFGDKTCGEILAEAKAVK